MTTKRASLFGSVRAIDPPEPPATPSEPAVASKPVYPKASTRIGKRVMAAHVSPECWKQAQMIAVDENLSIDALIREGLNHVFAARGLTRLA
jgi:hypothetical protein